MGRPHQSFLHLSLPLELGLDPLPSFNQPARRVVSPGNTTVLDGFSGTVPHDWATKCGCGQETGTPFLNS